MTNFDVFNGDADGICALHQLRLAEPRESRLITGVKRDIQLLKRVDAKNGDRVTVLDISLDKNREELGRVLDHGANVVYFDHHYAGEIPTSENLETHINTDGDVCTGWLVNQHLNGAFLPWAVTALFGDNLYDAAANAAAPLALNDDRLLELKQLGTLLNYNGYGSSLEDLFFAPDDLYRRVRSYEDPFEFIACDDAYERLSSGYQEDMRRATEIEPTRVSADYAAFLFPNEPFSRRVSGVYSNQLAREHPNRAHALLSLLPTGDYLVSVRAPLATKSGADDLCRQFPTGGGRKAAAGVNQLPSSMLNDFLNAMQEQFGS
ncbi:MAG: acetyltransferase [Planctomycetota bacterium]